MENNKDRTKTAVAMFLLCWFLGGYLLGCLVMNLYWRFSDRASAFTFHIAVYEDAVWNISKEDLFWQLLRRDLWLVSLLFPCGLVSWGGRIVCGMLSMGGVLLGILTSGILLSEGIYWWLKGMMWMLPCFLCSGSVLAGEILTVWRGTYRLHRKRELIVRQMLSYLGHIFLVICLTILACRVESVVLLAFFAKK